MEEREVAKIYEDLIKCGKEIIQHNINIISSLGKNAERYYKKIVEGCLVAEKICIVDKPSGQNQHEKYGKTFTEIWVKQWPTGTEGDTFCGFIYAKFSENKWLKIPYSC